MADLTLRDVRKAYGNIEILHGINLDIQSGEFIVFVGPSGCGKSTLLRAIAGLEDITSGTLQIAGETVNDVPPSKRGIAMVFQSYALYPHMTVYDNMAFGMKIARESKTEIDRRVRQAAEILQLTKFLERLPKALSGGQRQRVAIEIAKLKESMANTTMIYVTHDQVEAMTLADRIVVLKDGYVEQVGSPMELYKSPGNLFVAQFIGSPAMNIVPGTIDKAGTATVVAHVGGRKASVPIATPANAAGTSVSFGVRPEDLSIANGADYLFEGVVDYVEQLGEVQLIYLDIGRADQPLVTKLPGNAVVERGAKLKLTAESGDLHIFDGNGHSFALLDRAAKAA
jgi:ABC-type sugar transport system ATPase subunit